MHLQAGHRVAASSKRGCTLDAERCPVTIRVRMLARRRFRFEGRTEVLLDTLKGRAVDEDTQDYLD